ncbi:MAG: hypothetical protein O3A63_11195 [Proteobacteria bacterium]|nr:hypothetical protein [Pseudomonadota bacterium]
MTNTEDEQTEVNLGDEDEVEDNTDDDALLPDSDLEEFESDIGLGEDDDIDVVVELSQKELLKETNARSLEVRRAIEARVEAKRLKHDLDYLDLDLED